MRVCESGLRRIRCSLVSPQSSIASPPHPTHSIPDDLHRLRLEVLRLKAGLNP